MVDGENFFNQQVKNDLIFQEVYFESSQIRQVTIMYRFEHTNFLFQNV